MKMPAMKYTESKDMANILALILEHLGKLTNVRIQEL